MDRRIRLVALAFVGIIILFGGLAAIFSNQRSQTGTATITFDLPDLEDLEVKLNNETLEVKNLTDSYDLKTGDYNLTAQKPGYKDFSTNFTVSNQQAVVITVSMQRTQTSQSNLSQTRPEVNNSYEGWTIIGTEFFDDESWALISLKGEGDLLGYAIVKYSESAQSWQTVINPTSSFATSDLDAKNIPDDLVNYLNENNLTIDI